MEVKFISTTRLTEFLSKVKTWANDTFAAKAQVNNKQDKVVSAIENNLASFNDAGQVKDSTLNANNVQDIIGEYLTKTETLTNQEFVYREVPVEYDGTGTITSIKGNTIKFNQLVFNSKGNETSSGITFTSLGNCKYKINGTASAEAYYVLTDNMIPNHKMYIKFSPSNPNIKFERIGYPAYSSTGDGIILPVENAIAPMAIKIVNGTTIDNAEATFQCFDITAMGIDNLTTPAQVEEWLSTHIGRLDYYDFTLGDLISFKGTGLKTVGFNQWDEEWELGNINNATGLNINATNRWRCKNYIPVFPNVSYFLYNVSDKELNAFVYDENMDYMFTWAGNQWQYGSSGSSPIQNKIFTIPEGCHYLRFKYGGTDESSYQGNICLNISDVSKNGTYEPYTESILNLPILEHFPTGMKSIPNTQVYDRLTRGRADKILEIVDLGTLDYTYGSFSGINYFVTNTSPTGIKPATNFVKPNIVISSKYTLIASTNQGVTNPNFVDGTFFEFTSGLLFFRDSSYTSASDFKNAMNGVYLIYELANPITTDITPSLDLTYPIENGGTEQLLPTALLNRQVDLGSLNWTYLGNNLTMRFDTNIPDLLIPTNRNIKVNAICVKYKAESWSHVGEDDTGYFACYIDDNNNRHFAIRDVNYTDEVTFKQAMQGVILYYESTSSIPTTSNIIADIDYANQAQSRINKLDNIDLTDKESKNNKVTTLTESSTDTQYPSAKCVYDMIGNIETLLEEL